MPRRLFIGTSGWSYRHWQDCFYRNIRTKNRLSYYARQFDAVEVNATFYRLQNRRTLAKWHDETPADFRFAVKANRYLTHNKKLREPEKSIPVEKAHSEALSDKLAVVLWQLPANLARDPQRLAGFLDALQNWRETRHALEFRHPSWFCDDTATRLFEAEVAVCLSDAGDWPMWDRVTTDLVYLRLHGAPQTYASRYSSSQLQYWADRIRAWLELGKKVHAYFDNDALCAAPDNALELHRLLEPEMVRDRNKSDGGN